jgi:tetratricopeptide (TPR) repeat protein
MASACAQLDAFADGELAPDAHGRFVEHLSDCRDCDGRLADVLAISALADDAYACGRTSAGPPPAKLRQFTRLFLVAGVCVTAAATVMLVARTQASRDEPAEEIVLASLVDRSHRHLEGRLADDHLDPYRAFSNKRAAVDLTTIPPAIPGVEQALAGLEQRSDWHRLGVAHLLLGNPTRAERFFEKAGSAPAVLNDAAVLALQRAEHRRALALLDQALLSAPGSSATHWNRALALAGIGRIQEAIASMQAVLAAERDPGWSAEGRQRIANWRASLRTGGSPAASAPSP